MTASDRDICGGTGVVTTHYADGDPVLAACHGCAGCGNQVKANGRTDMRRRIACSGSPFALLPAIDDEEF